MCCAWAAEVQACTTRRVLLTWLSAWVRLQHDQQGLALHSHAETLVLSLLAVLNVHAFTASPSSVTEAFGNLWKLPARHDFHDL